ncbi:MAG: cytochrome c [Pyrinomonadaceae bacterium]
MKLIKLAFLAAAIMLSLVACNNTTNTNQTATTNTTTTTTNAPSASPTAAANTAATPADEFAAVRPVYAEHCARCHKVDGEGGTVEVLGKKLKVPSLKKGHALSHTDAELAKQIADGEDGMPAFKDRLNQQQIDALVRFIRKEFQSGATDKKESPKL